MQLPPYGPPRSASATMVATANGSNDGDNSSSASRKVNLLSIRTLIAGICIAIAFAPSAMCRLFFQPYHRGIWCDDTSIRMPFHESTLPFHWVGTVVMLFAAITFLFFELLSSRGHSNSTTARSYVVASWSVPDWLAESCVQFSAFVFGACLNQSATDVLKYSIGRLRPNFYEVCAPKFYPIDTCPPGEYVQEYDCTNPDPAEPPKSRVSFPSGHSSFVFFCAVYLALYVHRRMAPIGYAYITKVVAGAFVIAAALTAVSRLSDNKHFPTDVLGGSVLGTIVAYYVREFHPMDALKATTPDAMFSPSNLELAPHVSRTYQLAAEQQS